MKNKFSQILVPITLVVLVVILLNPFDFWMPDAALMLIILALVAVFSVFSVFVWRERALDEREEMHRLLAGRAAFLVGAAVLVAGIVFQSFEHSVDVWLVVALIAMITAKGLAHFYSDENL